MAADGKYWIALQRKNNQYLKWDRTTVQEQTNWQTIVDNKFTYDHFSFRSKLVLLIYNAYQRVNYHSSFLFQVNRLYEHVSLGAI